MSRRFDLSSRLLFRVSLLKLAGEDHVLIVSFHHIVSDGWYYVVEVRLRAAHDYGPKAYSGRIWFIWAADDMDKAWRNLKRLVPACRASNASHSPRHARRTV